MSEAVPPGRRPVRRGRSRSGRPFSAATSDTTTSLPRPTSEAASSPGLRSGATTDPDVAALWSRIEAEFHDNQHAIVESLAAKGALGAALEVDRAADILWTLNHPDVWRLLVRERGWTPDEWEEWLGDIAIDRLLKPALARPPKRR